MLRVLVVDDDDDVRMMVRYLLRRNGLEVAAEADDGDTAIAALERVEGVDVVLLDYRMPRMDGLACARVILERWPGQRVVLFTAEPADRRLDDRAAEAGIERVIRKVDLEHLAEQLVFGDGPR